MAHSAVVTFTARGSQRIISERGSQSWKLDRDRMRSVEYLVCTQNRHNGPWGGMDHDHRAAFLVGRVSGVAPSSDTPNRWRIEISEFARINLPEVWDKSRFPVRYTTLEELGIDVSTLVFEPLDADSPDDDDEQEIPPLSGIRSVEEAKKALSVLLNVPSDAIEINVRY